MKLKTVLLGLTDYGAALELQQKLLEARIQGKIGDVLLLLEHPPVITLGRRGEYSNIIASRERLEAEGVAVYEVSRGGDVTYHGPGQIVGYPIIDLSGYGRDIKDYIWRIEEVFIRLLKEEFGLDAYRDEKKYTGVWTGNEKIIAIGVAVKHWVTMHGFAFNVNTNLEHFKWINPCGITDRGVTSLRKITGKAQDMDKLKLHVMNFFCSVFGVQNEYVELKDIIN